VAYEEKYLQDFNMQGETCPWGLFKCTRAARAVSVFVTRLTVNTAVGRNPSSVRGLYLAILPHSDPVPLQSLWVQ